MEDNLITVNDAHLSYGEKEAIKGISLNIKRHTIHAFIGPSGCGKSTFLRCLNRMNDLIPNCKISGDFLIDGQDIYDHKTDINLLRKKVGMVFQKPNPFPSSIFDNVAYAPRSFGIKKKDELMKIVEGSLKKAFLWDEIKDRLKDSALSLSGGQLQRLCVARALAADPEILLLDEPTSALDPISTAKIEELILNLKKDITIIIVTHNMQQASRIADYTSFFLMGELIETQETEKLFSSPIDEKTENYITGRFGWWIKQDLKEKLLK